MSFKKHKEEAPPKEETKEETSSTLADTKPGIVHEEMQGKGAETKLPPKEESKSGPQTEQGQLAAEVLERGGSVLTDETPKGPVPKKWVRVDLAKPVFINGVQFGPGDGIEILEEAYAVYKNALK